MILLKIRRRWMQLTSNNIAFGRNKVAYHNGECLYRRSKPHLLVDHWNETRLGEISVNWSYISSNSRLVLMEEANTDSFFSTKFTKVITFDTSKYPTEDLPPKVIEDGKGNYLKVDIEHDPLTFNYAHCNIQSYLTTADGNLHQSQIMAHAYDTHPLKKKLRKLRNEYKTVLAYWFQDI